MGNTQPQPGAGAGGASDVVESARSPVDLDGALAHKEHGNQAFAAGELEDALAAYDQALALLPVPYVLPGTPEVELRVSVLSNKAQCLLRLQRWEDAAAAAKAALELDSTHAKSAERLRMALEKLFTGARRLEQAEQALMAGDYLIEQGRYDDAIGAFKALMVRARAQRRAARAVPCGRDSLTLRAAGPSARAPVRVWASAGARSSPGGRWQTPSRRACSRAACSGASPRRTWASASTSARSAT